LITVLKSVIKAFPNAMQRHHAAFYQIAKQKGDTMEKI